MTLGIESAQINRITDPAFRAWQRTNKPALSKAVEMVPLNAELTRWSALMFAAPGEYIRSEIGTTPARREWLHEIGGSR